MGVIVRAGLALVFACVAVGFAPSSPSATQAAARATSARTLVVDLRTQPVVELPSGTTHVSLEWHADHDATDHDAGVSIAFGEDGITFGEAAAVPHDESAGAFDAAPGPATTTDDHAADEIVRSGVLWTGGARYARLTADAEIARVTVTAIDAGPSSATVGSRPIVPSTATDAKNVEPPPVIARATWGANESWRFADDGMPLWPEEFFAVQKLIVHHTAGMNDDPDPAQTVRAIQHYQAIDRGWGDIGYNFLIDEQGRIYEGRFSREYAPGEVPSGTDLSGNSVQGAHVLNHNSGTIGIALLGNLMDRDATPQARAALEWLLAWLSQLHGIDPVGDGLYVNPHPDGTTQKHNPNISGHRDWSATLCPGDTFYATLPHLRQRVAALVAGEEPPTEPPPVAVPGAAELSAVTAPRKRGVRLNWTAPDDGGAPISAYRVLRYKKGSFVRVATLGGGTLTWRDRNTRTGRTYTYVVRAVNSKGVGPYSNQASAVAR